MECEGCPRKNDKFTCFLSTKEEMCPCSICILKTICEDACEKFLEHVFDFNGHLREVYKNNKENKKFAWKRT